MKKYGHKGQGENWIRQEKRLAIYLRDGVACVYCGATLEKDILTLDHLQPSSNGGNNSTENLVTSCKHCNSARQDMEFNRWLRLCGQWYHKEPKEIRATVKEHTARSIDVPAAKKLIAQRGSALKAIQK